MKVLYKIFMLFKKSYIQYFKDKDLFVNSEYFDDDEDEEKKQRLLRYRYRIIITDYIWGCNVTY
jgi:hypothetical protein